MVREGPLSYYKGMAPVMYSQPLINMVPFTTFNVFRRLVGDESKFTFNMQVFAASFAGNTLSN